MHRIAIGLCAFILSAHACYYDPGTENTCIVTELGAETGCQALANTIAANTFIDSNFFYNGRTCYAATAVSCRTAAKALDVLYVPSVICDAASVEDIVQTYKQDDYAEYLYPTAQYSSTGPPSTDSEPRTPETNRNTPVDQGLNRWVAPVPIVIPPI